jgi:hypothetical protein
MHTEFWFKSSWKGTICGAEVCILFQSVLREGYLKEMIQVLSDPRYGSNLTQVDATVKKHEAISADILARVCDGPVLLS